MPFDGTDFHPRKQPSRRKPKETVLCVFFFIFAVSLLVMPISMGGIIDVVRYVQGR